MTAVGSDEYGSGLLSEAIPELASGDWRLVSCETTASRKKARKRILECALTYANGRDGEARRTEELVVKIYGSDRGEHSHRTLQALWDAGFRPPSESCVPRSYGYSAAHGALVQEKVVGTPWADLLASPSESLVGASATAARWLLRLQTSAVEAEERSAGEALRELDTFVANLSGAYPEVIRALEPIANALRPALSESNLPLVPSHGDFHPKNVFIHRGLASVIDFDTFGRREPAFDAGYAIGQLLVMSRFRYRSLRRGAQAAAAFWQRYSEEGTAKWARVAMHVARTLLQSLHYELCIFRNGRTWLLADWPELAQRVLDSDGPEFLDALAHDR